MNSKQQWELYKDARLAYEEAKEFSNELERKWREEEQKLVDAMVEEGVRSFANDDGSKPTLTKNVSIKCNKDNAGDVRHWLVEQVGDDADFVEETVNRFKVAAYVKKLIEKGRSEDDFPTMLGLNTHPAIRVYGWDKSK